MPAPVSFGIQYDTSYVAWVKYVLSSNRAAEQSPVLQSSLLGSQLSSPKGLLIFFYFILRRTGKNKPYARTLPHIKYEIRRTCCVSTSVTIYIIYNTEYIIYLVYILYIYIKIQNKQARNTEWGLVSPMSDTLPNEKHPI